MELFLSQGTLGNYNILNPKTNINIQWKTSHYQNIVF